MRNGEKRGCVDAVGGGNRSNSSNEAPAAIAVTTKTAAINGNEQSDNVHLPREKGLFVQRANCWVPSVLWSLSRWEVNQ